MMTLPLYPSILFLYLPSLCAYPLSVYFVYILFLLLHLYHEIYITFISFHSIPISSSPMCISSEYRLCVSFISIMGVYLSDLLILFDDLNIFIFILITKHQMWKKMIYICCRYKLVCQVYARTCSYNYPKISQRFNIFLSDYFSKIILWASN